jgi:hypothetical protein
MPTVTIFPNNERMIIRILQSIIVLVTKILLVAEGYFSGEVNLIEKYN